MQALIRVSPSQDLRTGLPALAVNVLEGSAQRLVVQTSVPPCARAPVHLQGRSHRARLLHNLPILPTLLPVAPERGQVRSYAEWMHDTQERAAARTTLTCDIVWPPPHSPANRRATPRRTTLYAVPVPLPSESGTRQGKEVASRNQ